MACYFFERINLERHINQVVGWTEVPLHVIMESAINMFLKRTDLQNGGVIYILHIYTVLWKRVCLTVSVYN